jgi:hypothetical protein
MEQKIIIPEGFELVKNSDNEYVIREKEKKAKVLELIAYPRRNDAIDYHTKEDDYWAFSVCEGEHDTESGCGGEKITGNMASLYLPDVDGKWFNEDGNELKSGYLFFKPDTE